MVGEERVIFTVKGTIPPDDEGLKQLLKEVEYYRGAFMDEVKRRYREMIREIKSKTPIYSQLMWVPLDRLLKFLRNLPIHPVPFHNQSYWIEKEKGDYYLYFKNKQNERGVPIKCRFVPDREADRKRLDMALGKENDVRGQLELVEDKKNKGAHKYGKIRCHIALRLPKPQPYEPKGWLGVDTGWNKLAVSIFVRLRDKGEVEFKEPTIHGEDFKGRVKTLKARLRDYQRRGKAIKKWRNRLKNTTDYAVGVVAKEIVRKAEELTAGIALEDLSFPSVTKRYLIPRYKLQQAIRNLCERRGVPFKLVSPQNTSITCPKCDYADKENRRGERFSCADCGYDADADVVGAMNIGRRALGVFKYRTKKKGEEEEEKKEKGKRKKGRAAAAKAATDHKQHKLDVFFQQNKK